MAQTSTGIRGLDRLPAFATVLALAACYGTLAVVGILSLLGATLAPHDGAWAGAISLFAVLAFIGTVLGYRKHGGVGPAVTGLLGAALIVGVMFGPYSFVAELGGFALLIVAAWWDWKLKRSGQAEG
jgi:hypothetical protein